MSELTDFREAVRAELAKDLAMEMVPQVLVGPFEDRSIGCVWIDTGAQAGMEQDITVRVRVFKQWAMVEPYGKDPAELEDIPELVNASLKDIQTTASGMWFFSIQRFTIDQETWGVEVELLARRENPFLS